MKLKKALDKTQLESVYDKKSKGYDRYHGFVTLNSDQRGRELLVEHAVQTGNVVLDAGGGTGSTALLAAIKAGDGGRVNILDLSEGMLEVARQRAAEMGIEDRMTFVKGDMDKMPFDDASFDVVLSTYSTCPLGDPVEACYELLRVLKPGGLLGVAHSAAPEGFFSKMLGNFIEKIAWHFPSISLGCRAVEILPALEAKGYKTVFKKRIGPGFLPFIVFVVEK